MSTLLPQTLKLSSTATQRAKAMTGFPVYKWDEITDDIKHKIMTRSELDVSKFEKEVARIIQEVREKGDAAITEFLSRQVGKSVRPEEIRVQQADITAAYQELDGKVTRSIKHLIRNVRKFHRREVSRAWMMQIEPGVFAGQRIVPLDSAGLYCPSGKASYPSVSAMVTIPASVAGVSRIALACPPKGDEMKMDPGHPSCWTPLRSTRVLHYGRSTCSGRIRLRHRDG